MKASIHTTPTSSQLILIPIGDRALVHVAKVTTALGYIQNLVCMESGLTRPAQVLPQVQSVQVTIVIF